METVKGKKKLTMDTQANKGEDEVVVCETIKAIRHEEHYIVAEVFHQFDTMMKRSIIQPKPPDPTLSQPQVKEQQKHPYVLEHSMKATFSANSQIEQKGKRVKEQEKKDSAEKSKYIPPHRRKRPESMEITPFGQPSRFKPP